DHVELRARRRGLLHLGALEGDAGIARQLRMREVGEFLWRTSVAGEEAVDGLGCPGAGRSAIAEQQLSATAPEDQRRAESGRTSAYDHDVKPLHGWRSWHVSWHRNSHDSGTAPRHHPNPVIGRM